MKDFVWTIDSHFYPVSDNNKVIYLQYVIFKYFRNESWYHLFVISLNGFLVLFETPKEMEMKSSPAIHAQSCGTMLFSTNILFFWVFERKLKVALSAGKMKNSPKFFKFENSSRCEFLYARSAAWFFEIWNYSISPR